MDVFVARQPIFTRQRSVYGYEILFRSGIGDAFHAENSHVASIQVLHDSCFLFGLDALTGGGRAFIKFTHNSLVNGYAELWPSDRLVVEILDDVTPDDQAVAACRRLKAAGYTLALNSFMPPESHQDAFLPWVDMVKTDCARLEAAERRPLSELFDRPGLVFLADQVETEDDFLRAEKAGYTYFQGFFFSHPTLMTGRKPERLKPNHVQLLQEVHRSDLNYDRLTALIKPDVSLVYRICRYLNSAAVGLRTPVTSVRRALVMLGEANIRRCLCLMVLTDLGVTRSSELVRLAAVRAALCEAVAQAACWPGREHELFLMGLFSTIDALLRAPMADIVGDLPLSADVQGALLGQPGLMRTVYDFAVACERGDWGAIDRCRTRLGMAVTEVAALYLRAVQWADDALAGQDGS